MGWEAFYWDFILSSGGGCVVGVGSGSGAPNVRVKLMFLVFALTLILLN